MLQFFNALMSTNHVLSVTISQTLYVTKQPHPSTSHHFHVLMVLHQTRPLHVRPGISAPGMSSLGMNASSYNNMAGR